MIGRMLLEGVLGHVAVNAGKADDVLVGRLRDTYSGVHFSVCSDDDMPPRLPFAAEGPRCRLYYVKSGEHCLSLTTDAESATGLVVALRDQGE